MNGAFILGGGVTGLAAGVASGLPVYEAEPVGGGICSSYYMRPGRPGRFSRRPEDGEAYRFEIGGGHWIFGGAPEIVDFLKGLMPFVAYERRASVFLPNENLHIPYPLQNHLDHLGRERAEEARVELRESADGAPRTMADWIGQSFGASLTELFFGPFHEAYTAGLWTRIAPQDAYKSPARKSTDDSQPVGYNQTFLYPREGLDHLARRLAEDCDIHFGKRAVAIDPQRQEVTFADGSGLRYERLVGTLPLDRMMAMAGLSVDSSPDPYTSVLVLNIGARRGTSCPDSHWVYVPRSESGFHRVGFYSNVDVDFLPRSRRANGAYASLYVERAYPGGQKPSKAAIEAYTEKVLAELAAWGFIDGAEIVDPTWIDVAYTWAWPESRWREEAMGRLEEHNIMPVGRYARWIFQGIADSVRDGLAAGKALQNLAAGPGCRPEGQP